MPNTPPSAERLRTVVARLERLDEDKAAISSDIKEVYSEAKGEGFDTKILRKVIRLRRLSKAARQEEEALIDLYLGTLDGSGEAARAAQPTYTSARTPTYPPPNTPITQSTTSSVLSTPPGNGLDVV